MSKTKIGSKKGDSPSTFDWLIHLDVSHCELLLFRQILQKLDKVRSGHGNDRALVEPENQIVGSKFTLPGEKSIDFFRIQMSLFSPVPSVIVY